MVPILENLDYKRLCEHALTRLDKERGTHPVCSEYLQALVELTSVMRHCQTVLGADTNNSNSGLLTSDSPIAFPPLEIDAPKSKNLKASVTVAESPTSVDESASECTRRLYEDCMRKKIMTGKPCEA